MTWSAIACGVILLVSPKLSTNKPSIAKATHSSNLPSVVSDCASLARLSIPFYPVSVAIVIPAKINNTIIVITNAINVIPFVAFNFSFTCFSSLLLF